jgi:hypothetical protein
MNRNHWFPLSFLHTVLHEHVWDVRDFKTQEACLTSMEVLYFNFCHLMLACGVVVCGFGYNLVLDWIQYWYKHAYHMPSYSGSCSGRRWWADSLVCFTWWNICQWNMLAWAACSTSTVHMRVCPTLWYQLASFHRINAATETTPTFYFYFLQAVVIWHIYKFMREELNQLHLQDPEIMCCHRS